MSKQNCMYTFAVKAGHVHSFEAPHLHAAQTLFQEKYGYWPADDQLTWIEIVEDD
jgi:hypothetical protein